MPIEIRPSDVMFQAAESLGKWSDLFGEIFDREYDKERVKQINGGLVILEMAWQKQLENAPTRGFEVRQQYEEGMRPGVPPAAIGPTVKTLGQLTLSELEEDYQKSVKALEDQINRTVTNKRAREEMLAHLAAGAVQQRGRLVGQWQKATEANFMAGLQNLMDTVMMSSDTSEVKIEKISSRVREGVASGWMEKDQAEKYIAVVENQARYVEANAGVMQVLEDSGLEAAEKWLNENTPYWEGNPEMRQKVLNEARAEWDYDRRIQDEQLNEGFADAHIRADSIAKVDAALKELTVSDFYDEDKKYYWEQRFMARKEYLLKLQKVPPASVDDYYKDQFNKAKWQIAKALNDGVPAESVKALVYKMMEDPAGPRLLGAKAAELLDYINQRQSPAVKYGLDYIKSKGAGLSDIEEMKVSNQLQEFLKENPDATTKDIEDAVSNFIKEPVRRKLDDFFRGTLDVVRRDAARKSEAERMTEDIQSDRYTGLVRSRKLELDEYNAYMKDLAIERYPDQGIVGAYTDEQGEITGHQGTAVLVDGLMNPYYFKLVGQVLTLYRMSKTRGGEEVWIEITPPAAIQARIQAEAAAAAKEERKEVREEIREEKREIEEAAVQTRATEVPGAMEAGYENIILEDWNWTGKTWKHKGGATADKNLAAILNRLSGRE